jgi:hypothetical protein
MNTVTVETNILMLTVQKNRKAHRELFLKAEEGYRADVIVELEKMLLDARSGGPIRRVVQLPEPIDRTKDYDRILAMLSMTSDKQIVLEAFQFDQYVLDNWEWKQAAHFTNSTYAMKARP